MHNNNAPHHLTDQVKLLQKVAIVHNGRVLLLKRSADSKSRPEKWDLPGGNSEWPKTTESGDGQFAQDAVREVQEETTIVLNPDLFTESALMYLNTYFDAPRQIYSIIFGWCVSINSQNQPQVVISDEHSEHVWVTLDEIEKYDFDATGEFVLLTARRGLTHTLAHKEL
ncbi:MAG: NUDIX domain-containing protein [Microgenomates group bacterium]